MAALINIFNSALGRVKEKPLISVDDAGAAGRSCRASYEVQRPALLRRHRWPFALRRVALAPLLTTPAFGWAHEMTLPDDLLAVVSASPDASSGRRILTDAPETYRIEGGKLLTDSALMYLLYVADVTDTQAYDGLFTDCLSWSIATDLALSIAADATLAEVCNKRREEAMLLARRANSIEQPAEGIVMRGSVDARLGRAIRVPGMP